VNFVVIVSLCSKSLLYFRMQTPAYNNGRKQFVVTRQAMGAYISVGTEPRSLLTECFLLVVALLMLSSCLSRNLKVAVARV
jgi:hypothetical protein